MGKIIDMQNYYNNMHKEKLDTKGIKNFYNKLRLVYAPGIQNKYNLTSSQKKFARTVRGASIGIVALASALTIGATVTNHVSSNLNGKDQYTTEVLNKDDLIEEANNILLKSVFGEDLDNIKNPQIDYLFDDADGSYTLRIKGNGDIVYMYTDSLSLDSLQNNKDITKLIDKLIKMQNNEPSQKDLQKLSELIDNLEDKTFELKNGNIVEQKEIDNER